MVFLKNVKLEKYGSQIRTILDILSGTTVGKPRFGTSPCHHCWALTVSQRSLANPSRTSETCSEHVQRWPWWVGTRGSGWWCRRAWDGGCPWYGSGPTPCTVSPLYSTVRLPVSTVRLPVSLVRLPVSLVRLLVSLVRLLVSPCPDCASLPATVPHCRLQCLIAGIS